MKTLVQFFEENVKRFNNNPYLWEKRAGKYTPTTYGKMRELVHQFASGLHVLGVKHGDRLALLAEGRTNWVVAEMGMFYLGAIDVPLSIQLNESTDLIFRLKHSESSMIVVSQNQLPKVTAIKKQLPDLKTIILMDPKDTYEKDEIYMGDIMESGKKFLENNAEEFKKIYESIDPDDVAKIYVTPQVQQPIQRELC